MTVDPEVAQGHVRVDGTVGCFRQARVQVILMGIIMACFPGSFNSILCLKTGLEPYQSPGFAMLYFINIFTAFLAPLIIAKLGLRTTLCLGGMWYVLFNATEMLAGPMNAIPKVMVTVMGAAVGLGAGPLWAAQGAMTLSQATERSSASYFATVWVLFNLGAVVNGLQAFATNLNETSKGASANTATFAIFVGQGILGMVLCYVILPLEKCVRDDGTLCKAYSDDVNLRAEIRGMLRVLKYPPVLALLPLFIYSNWFYGFQTGTFFKVFEPAASGLGNALYWGAQMIGCKVLGWFLDSEHIPVGRRSWISFIASTGLITVGWTWGTAMTLSLKVGRAEQASLSHTDSEVIPVFALIFVWGFCDALTQNWCYWVMGVLFKSAEDLARVVGVFKGVQAIGSSLGFLLGFANLTALSEVVVNVVVFVLSVPGAIYLCKHCSKPPSKDELLDK